MPKRQAFLDEPVTDRKIRHLRIVITDKNDSNEYLTVPVDTLKFHFQDSSCIIAPHEHPFIKEQSFVNYRYAKVLSFAEIFNGIRHGVFITKEDVSAELLIRIQNGARATKHLRNEMKVWLPLF